MFSGSITIVYEKKLCIWAMMCHCPRQNNVCANPETSTEKVLQFVLYYAKKAASFISSLIPVNVMLQFLNV